jgi:nitric oxide reductase NorE protein
VSEGGGGSVSEPAAQAPREHIPGEAGLWLLIFGEMTFFAALFASFLLYRNLDVAGFAAGQTQLSKPIGLVNTMILLTSSLFVAKGVDAARRGDTGKAPRLFAWGLACAFGFAALKGVEYTELFARGIAVNSHTFYSFYFGLTALHLGHVLIGGIFLALLMRFTAAPLAKSSHLALTESAGVFWHMVDLLWIVIFALVYLVE